jgi:hypothetical protein
MNIARIRNTLALALSTLLLATACGGGDDDEAGSMTPLSVVPNDVTVTGPAGFCPGSGQIMTARIYGGTAPYRLDNAFPQLVGLDKASVGDRGGSFIVTSLGAGCLDKGSIVIRDKNERQVVLTVTLEEGS